MEGAKYIMRIINLLGVMSSYMKVDLAVDREQSLHFRSKEGAKAQKVL